MDEAQLLAWHGMDEAQLEELQQTEEKKIPSALCPLWDNLRDEVIYLHARWKIFRQLYAGSQTRIDLLNETAGSFFHMIQLVLLEHTVLSLSRLLDPAQSGNYQNATLAQLVSHSEIQAHPCLAEELKQQLEKAKEICTPFCKVRNKRIAHRDFNTALKIDPNPLPGISRQNVEDALKASREFMNTVERFFTQSSTGYEHCIMDKDGDSLVAYLRLGVAYGEAERARIIPWDFSKKTKYADA